MDLPVLKIGNLIAAVPIVQGGMAIRISMSNLAAAVANEGGIGLIAATGMGLDELREEIRKARTKSSGIIGINIMVAARQFLDIVRVAIEEKIDLIVAGSGFSRDVFSLCAKERVPFVPIVSSMKLAVIAEKLGASAIIVEGKEAGGHLGTDKSIKELITSIKSAVSIPVVAAGGITSGKDVVSLMKMGADGVQIGTMFALSKESNAADEWKEFCLMAGVDEVMLIDSPVGLPGRALYNQFIQRLKNGDNLKPEKCDLCLKKCAKTFCIKTALINAQKGNLQEGLIFSGENIANINKIVSVKEIFACLLEEIKNN